MLELVDRIRPGLAWFAATALAALVASEALGLAGWLPEPFTEPLVVSALAGLLLGFIAYVSSFAVSSLLTAWLLEASVKGLPIPWQDRPERQPYLVGFAAIGLIPDLARDRADLLSDSPGERRYNATSYRASACLLACIPAAALALLLDWLGSLISETGAAIGLIAGGCVVLLLLLQVVISTLKGYLFSVPPA
jgi:hypothetical protein